MDLGYDITIKGFGDRLLQVSPIKNGWSVIGRTDKFLSAAAVKLISCTRNKLKLRLHESGPLGIWMENGTPSASGVEFTQKGKGFFIADLPVKATPTEITIKRKR